MNKVTIVMYHYVRELKKTRYPGIKGLDVDAFRKQIRMLEQEYTFITVEECMEQLETSKPILPEKAALLTFDDGYLEHFTHVFPILDSKGIQGAFFPPVHSAAERKILDVNKIHFILAAHQNPDMLIGELEKKIEGYKSEFNLLNPNDYFNRITIDEHPYDPVEIIKFKRVLQRELPKIARQTIIRDLFNELVGVPESVFAEELYMNIDQIKHMKRHGMFIGGHGYSHDWLNAMDESTQRNEVIKTKSFLDSVGADAANWVMCYPYGGYDQSLIEVLKSEKCSMGLTTEDKVAIIGSEYRYRIPRVDTNEV